MKLVFLKVIIFFSLFSCSNINFLLDEKKNLQVLKNKTLVYVDGWERPILKEVLFLKLGEATEERFLLSASVEEKQIKRSVNENQVAQKIDYKITIDYKLKDLIKKCPDINNIQKSNFSFTPKSSGYNFASDVLLENLYEEAVLNSVNAYVYYAINKIMTYNCLNEG